MLNLGHHLVLEAKAKSGAVQQGPVVRPSARPRAPTSPPVREQPRRPSPIQASSRSGSKHASLSEGDDRTGHSDPDEWTSHNAYEYALKRAEGYVADEERVAVAIFYSLCADPSSSYAAMDENDKERMRWCARAAIAAVAEKCKPSR